MNRPCVAILALLSCVPCEVRAEILVYTDQSDFFSAASEMGSPIVSTTTFEDRLGNVGSPATIDQITYTPDNPSGTYRIDSYGSQHSLIQTELEASTLTFGGGQTRAIGFVTILGVSVFPPLPRYEFKVVAIDGEELSFHQAIDIGEGAYWGFISPQGIRSVTIGPYRRWEGATNFTFDDVSRAAIVPEPSTLALFAIGAIALAITAARRRPA